LQRHTNAAAPNAFVASTVMSGTWGTSRRRKALRCACGWKVDRFFWN